MTRFLQLVFLLLAEATLVSHTATANTPFSEAQRMGSAAASLSPLPGAAPFITQQSFGGVGGSPFAAIEDIMSFSIRAGKRVDQLKINNVAHGGGGGKAVMGGTTIVLAPKEYISAFTIRSGNEIDYLSFTTNRGRTIGGGGGGGGLITKTGIRVLSIEGRSGSRLDNLTIKWVENYTPSVVIETNRDFIIDFIAPGQEVIKYTSTESTTVAAFEKTLVAMSSWGLDASASVKTELLGEVKTATKFAGSTTSTTVVKNQLTDQLKNSTQVKQTIGSDEVGLYVTSQTIMRGLADDGATPIYWVYPDNPASSTRLIVIKKKDYEVLLNKYDLTRQLGIQLPGLAQYAMEQNGFSYFKKP